MNSDLSYSLLRDLQVTLRASVSSRLKGQAGRGRPFRSLVAQSAELRARCAAGGKLSRHRSTSRPGKTSGDIEGRFRGRGETPHREGGPPLGLGRKNNHKDHCYQTGKSIPFRQLRVLLCVKGPWAKPLPAAATLWPQPELHPR